MARVTYVKAAQQRYEMVDVLDDNGEPVRTPVMGKNGQQKTDKRGRPVFMTKTVKDLTKPLPNHECGKCGKEIEVGQPYKWIAPKSGPYGGRKLYRCGDCPVWNVWEYSSSLSARVAEISFNFWEAIASAESNDDVQSALDDAASQVREIAEEKEESASNIEDGFGHETQTSQDLRDVAEQLESWATDIESADIPDFPEGEGEVDCETCGGTGQGEPRYHVFNAQGEDTNEEGYETEDDARANLEEQDDYIEEQDVDCDDCGGTGKVEADADEPTEEQISEWRDEVQDAVSIIDECPV